MRKIFLIGAVMFFLFTVSCFAGNMGVNALTDSTGSATMVVTGTGAAGTIYTKSFPIKSADKLGLAYKATGTTTAPNITLQLQQSFQKPTTEYAVDTSYQVGVGLTTVIANITSQSQVYTTLYVVPAPYARFKIINNNGVNTAANMQLKVIKIE